MALQYGAWGTPEFGISEKLSDLLGKGRTAQGGSNLFGSSTPTSSAYAGSPAPQGVTQYQSPIGPQPAGSVLGASTSRSTSTGGNSGLLSSLFNTSGADQAARQSGNAAQSEYDAALQAENTGYDQNRESLLSQLGYLSTQKDQSLNELNTAIQGVRGEVAGQKDQTMVNRDREIADASNSAQSAQRKNRNVLRGLGILNSTAAGELLSKPINEFDKQKGQINESARVRFNQLDDFLNNKVAEGMNKVASLQSQYAQLTDNIQRDLRFNDRQKLDAVKSARAALQSRLNEISNSVMSYKQQVDAQKQNFALQLAQIKAYNDPKADLTSILSTIFSPGQGQATQTASIYGDPQKKEESGLLSALN